MAKNLCDRCTAMCCRYFALPLDTPETAGQFDDIRWYLLHRDVEVFVEDGEWYLHVLRPCKHLLPDNRCGIYETRPRVCRKHTTKTCEYHDGDYGYEQHFTTADALAEYAKAYLRRKYRKSSTTTAGRNGRGGKNGTKR